MRVPVNHCIHPSALGAGRPSWLGRSAFRPFEGLSERRERSAKDCHQVLPRVRKLTGRASDGPPRGDKPSNSALLWRTRSKTNIAMHKRSSAADDPATAQYYLFTVRAADRIGVELRGIKTAPDLLILDLSRNARGPAGVDLVEACRRDGQLHARGLSGGRHSGARRRSMDSHAARFELLGAKQPGRKGKVIRAPGHVV